MPRARSLLLMARPSWPNSSMAAKSRRRCLSIRRRNVGLVGGSRSPDCRSSIGTTCSRAMNGFSSMTRRSKATPLEPLIQAERLIDSAMLAEHSCMLYVLHCTEVLQQTGAVGQNAKCSERAEDFRFAPKLGHCSMRSACLKGTTSDFR